MKIVHYYMEPNGDFIAVRYKGKYWYHGSGAVVDGIPESMGQASFSESYLNSCKYVYPPEIPERWRKALRISD